MKKRSAGLLVYRTKASVLEVFLVHPGGPYWANKDSGSWSIPKGLYVENEEPLVAARREFTEETGHSIDGEFWELGDFKQPSGKIIAAWAVEGDCDASTIVSNVFSIEWPPKSGKFVEFPEVDRASWFCPEDAEKSALVGQVQILDTLLLRLGVPLSAPPGCPSALTRAPGR